MNLAIFLSGRGSNFLSIAKAIECGDLSAEITLVASNREDAAGLETARQRNIPTVVFDRKRFDQGSEFGSFMLSKLSEHEVDFIALAGYLRKIPPMVIKRYSNRIVNIHPALLPRYGGKGMYGMAVHQAVIESGDTVSGVTIHFVDEIYDNGEIIHQEEVPVLPGDTAEKLAARVLKVEHRLYPAILQELVLRENTR